MLILYNEPKLNEHYDKVLRHIRHSKRNKIRFGAYIMYDSDYAVDKLFTLMMKEKSKWDPHIVIVPDVSRGYTHAREQYLKTRKFLQDKYESRYIIDGWDLKHTFYDHLKKFDVVYYNSPYDAMAHPYHKIRYASRKNVLPFYITYGYEVSKNYTIDRYKGFEINCLWRCYTDTVYSYNDYVNDEVRKGRNVKLIGYSKMDNFSADESNVDKKRKTILITSHHTVTDKNLPMSNFLLYYELITELPVRFPDMDFIFRPHPLLFINLINEGLWTQNEVRNYLKLLAKKGVEYSDGGDYFELFNRADAIINDCGSFTVEWLYTGKPGCFVWNPNLKESMLTTLMNKAISEYKIAYNKEDIIDFVSEIANEKSQNSHKMKPWVKENIAINYPNVSEAVLRDLYVSIFEDGFLED